MKTDMLRPVGILGGCAWLGVGGYGISSAVVESGDHWRVGYALFTAALLVGALCTVLIVAIATREVSRPRLRMAGLVVSGIGCAAALVLAWALPLWMAFLGLGFALVGVAAGPGRGRVLAVLAAAHPIAVAVLIAVAEAEIGRTGEWGDHPAAGGIALVVVAAITVAAILKLIATPDPVATVPSSIRTPA